LIFEKNIGKKKLQIEIYNVFVALFVFEALVCFYLYEDF
jgi:hypothetical protein